MVQYLNDVSVSCCSNKIGQFTVRYVLEIETQSEISDSVTCIMMNPSKANLSESDGTVNKIIKFLELEYKKISICNIFPFHKTDSSEFYYLIKEFREKYGEEKFDRIMNENLLIIEKTIKSNNKLVFAWGDSPNGFNKKIYNYYASKIIEVANNNFKRKYVFKTTHKNGHITQSGYPRHPSRNSLNGLLEVEVLDMPYLILK